MGETSRQAGKLEQQLRDKESQYAKVKAEKVSKTFLFRSILVLVISILASSAAGYLYANPRLITKEHWCAPVRPGIVLQVGQNQHFGGTRLAPWWNHPTISDSKKGNKMARWFERTILSCPDSSMAEMEWKKDRLTIRMKGTRKSQSYKAPQGALLDATQITLYQQNGKQQVIDAPW